MVADNTVIAVVNDDTSFLELMHDLLTESGYQVFILKEGASAYEKLKSKKPDLVILDIRIDQPEGGLSILELLKLDPETNSMPIIVCSADVPALRANEVNYREHGIRSLAKPFNVDDLLAMVEEALGDKEQT